MLVLVPLLVIMLVVTGGMYVAYGLLGEFIIQSQWKYAGKKLYKFEYTKYLMHNALNIYILNEWIFWFNIFNIFQDIEINLKWIF